MDTIKVEVWLTTSSHPVVHDAEAVFTQGALLCIREAEWHVDYPLCHVHKVVSER